MNDEHRFMVISGGGGSGCDALMSVSSTESNPVATPYVTKSYRRDAMYSGVDSSLTDIDTATRPTPFATEIANNKNGGRANGGTVLVLELLVQNLKGVRRFHLNDHHSVIIGRGKDCDVQYMDPTVSENHAIIIRDSIFDTHSTNGTFVNGCPVKKHKLIVGDVIKCGAAVIGTIEALLVTAPVENPFKSNVLRLPSDELQPPPFRQNFRQMMMDNVPQNEADDSDLDSDMDSGRCTPVREVLARDKLGVPVWLPSDDGLILPSPTHTATASVTPPRTQSPPTAVDHSRLVVGTPVASRAPTPVREFEVPASNFENGNLTDRLNSELHQLQGIVHNYRQKYRNMKHKLTQQQQQEKKRGD